MSAAPVPVVALKKGAVKTRKKRTGNTTPQPTAHRRPDQQYAARRTENLLKNPERAIVRRNYPSEREFAPATHSEYRDDAGNFYRVAHLKSRLEWTPGEPIPPRTLFTDGNSNNSRSLTREERFWICRPRRRGTRANDTSATDDWLPRPGTRITLRSVRIGLPNRVITVLGHEGHSRPIQRTCALTASGTT